MFTKDTNQRVRPPGQGQAINASDLRKILALILQCVKGGRGIQVQRVGQSVIVSQQAGTRGGGGGGGGRQVFYTASSKANLEAYTGVVVYARGRVISGADNGVDYIRNVDNDGWVATNRLE
jgi:hypothetical protein